MSIEIRSVGGKTLFASTHSSVKAAVEEAVSSRANLYGADLGGAGKRKESAA